MVLDYETYSFTFDKSMLALSPKMNSKKLMLFNFMTDYGKKLNDKISFKKCTLKSKASEVLLVFHPVCIESAFGEDKGYQFHRSSDLDSHWIVNFSDSAFLGYIESSLYAQEEYLASCLPGLYPAKHHVMQIAPQFFQIGNKRVMLVEGVKLYGRVDTSTKLERLESTLYGNKFICALDDEIQAHVALEEKPYEVNMLAIVAPFCREQGTPYRIEDIMTLLIQAYTGMRAIKESHSNVPITLETGNWGCGAFGNNAVITSIAQMVGASSAGIEKVIFYPREKEEEYKNALIIFESEILPKIQNGSLKSLQELGSFLHENALRFGLLYGASNNT